MNPINLGLVGIGKIARDQHLPALQLSGAFRLLACASRSARMDGADNFNDIAAMLEGCPQIEAVAICTPPQAHYEAARLSLLHGKHVFLEKPPCATTAQLDALIALAKMRGCSLFQTWHSRYAPSVEPARRWLSGRQVRHVRVTWKEDAHKWHPGQTWLWQPGGFGVFDPGINALSILTHILEQALYVKQAKLLFPANCGSPIAAELLIGSDDTFEIEAAFDFRQTGEQSWDIEVDTVDGVLKLRAGGSELFVDGKRAFGTAGAEMASEYTSLYRRFSDLIFRKESDVDARPFRLVADAFLIGDRITVEPFDVHPDSA